MFPSFFIIFSTILLLLTSAIISEGKDILVGGRTNAWNIPSPSSQTLNQWAESTRFRINDSLVWKLDGEKDSVLQVSREDYQSCNASNPISIHNSETNTTRMKLERSGVYYLISGEDGGCRKGVKMAVVVMAERKVPESSKKGKRPFFVGGGGGGGGGPTSAPAPAPVGSAEGFGLGPSSGGGGARMVLSGGAVWFVVVFVMVL